jgi:hypothetical protein
MKLIVGFCLTLILAGAGCNGTTTDVRFSEAISMFEEDILLENASSPLKESLIKTLSGSDRAVLFSEKVKYAETGHVEFPYTGLRSDAFKEPSGDSYIINEQLFIFDASRSDWLPVSSSKKKFDGESIQDVSSENLWDEVNDWREQYTVPSSSSDLLF